MASHAYAAEAVYSSMDNLKKRNQQLECENETLRDLLNDIAWRLGLDGNDVPEGYRVHYYDSDNYDACQSAVAKELAHLLDSAGQSLHVETSDALDVIKGCKYRLKSNNEVVTVNYVYTDSTCCEVTHCETGDTFTIHAEKLKAYE